ncbi:hypothetical protein EZH22_08700 [Xanthobacter dioxanivorans]|uniref:Uncharacterized protein n=1 Tax=Xanthobacter dioxanivorans TaxID=2528964 RepID=A0A974PRB7_9HYPH|nr:hypothetical protein [Xanthobacter dioxanivorans]QRG08352.1 hypothetical protein EZH22_08700 [Xanthobacter dioxanivorans]
MTIFMDRSLSPDAAAPERVRAVFFRGGFAERAGEIRAAAGKPAALESITVPRDQEVGVPCIFLRHGARGPGFAARSPLLLPNF